MDNGFVKRSLTALLASASLLMPSWMAGAGEDAAKGIPQFKDGERVCFVGDSITHGGLYHKYVSDVWQTQHPERRILFFNRGVCGDTVGDVLKRFDRDVAPTKPSYVFVMLGMNDVGCYGYTKDKTERQLADWQASRLRSYLDGMKKIVGKVKDLQPSAIVLLSPSIYDEYSTKPSGSNYVGTDAALARMTEELKKLADAEGCLMLDLHSPMRDETLLRLKSDPGFSFIGGDRVHPKSSGHLFMALRMLEAQGMGRNSSLLEIDAKSGKEGRLERFEVKSVKVSDKGVEVACKESCLPVALDKSLASSELFKESCDRLYSCVVKVAGLDAGLYELRLDGALLGEADAARLAEGLELSSLKSYPPLADAVKLSSMNDARFGIESKKVNQALAGLKMLQRKRGEKPTLPQDDIEAMKLVLPEVKDNYWRICCESFVECGSKIDELRQQSVDAQDAIHAAAQPKWRTLSVVRKDAAGK